MFKWLLSLFTTKPTRISKALVLELEDLFNTVPRKNIDMAKVAAAYYISMSTLYRIRRGVHRHSS